MTFKEMIEKLQIKEFNKEGTSTDKRFRASEVAASLVKLAQNKIYIVRKTHLKAMTKLAMHICTYIVSLIEVRIFQVQ